MLPIGNAWHWLSVAIVLLFIRIMLKALTAAAAITICCLGNEYPAKACYSERTCQISNELGQQHQERMIRQEMENRQNLLRYQMQQQQRYGSQY